MFQDTIKEKRLVCNCPGFALDQPIRRQSKYPAEQKWLRAQEIQLRSPTSLQS